VTRGKTTRHPPTPKEPQKENVHSPGNGAIDWHLLSCLQGCHWLKMLLFNFQTALRQANWATPNISMQFLPKWPKSDSLLVGAPRMPNSLVCAANMLTASGAVKPRCTPHPKSTSRQHGFCPSSRNIYKKISRGLNPSVTSSDSVKTGR
jgi:hypothetical protein